jgi:hypothetical protein
LKPEFEEYFCQAMMCNRLALREATPDLTAAWLRLAQDWLSLIPIDEYPGAVPFDWRSHGKLARDLEQKI